MKGYIVSYSEYDDYGDTGEVFSSKEMALKRLGAMIQELKEKFRPIKLEEYDEKIPNQLSLEQQNMSNAHQLKDEIEKWGIAEYELIMEAQEDHVAHVVWSPRKDWDERKKRMFDYGASGSVGIDWMERLLNEYEEQMDEIDRLKKFDEGKALTIRALEIAQDEFKKENEALRARVKELEIRLGEKIA